MGRRQGNLRSIESHDGLEDAVSKMRELIDLAAKTLASGDEMWCASLLGEAGRRGVFEYARMMDSITEKNNK